MLTTASSRQYAFLIENSLFINRLFIVQENQDFLLQFVSKKQFDKFLFAGNTNVDHVEKMTIFMQYKKNNRLYNALVNRLMTIHKENQDFVAAMIKTSSSSSGSCEENQTDQNDRMNVSKLDKEIVNCMKEILFDVHELCESNQMLQESKTIQQELKNLETMNTILNEEVKKLKAEIIKLWNGENEVKTQRQLNPGDSDEAAESLKQIADDFYKENILPEALKYYTLALEMYERLHEGDYDGISRCLNNIGCIYREQQQWNKSLEHFIRALEMRRRLFSNDDNVNAVILKNMGNLNKNQNKFKESLDYFTQSLEILQRLHQGDHFDIAQRLHTIAGVHVQMQQWNESLKYFTRCLEMLRRLSPNDSVTIADTLINVAESQKSLQHFSQALVCYSEAYKIYQTLFTEDHDKVKFTAEKIHQIKQLGKLRHK